MADDDAQNYVAAEAIMYGTIFPPDKKTISEAIRIPGIDKINALRGKGPVFSLKLLLSYAVPAVILLTIFITLHFVLPDSVPVFNDWVWVIGLPLVFAVPFYILLSGMKGMDDIVAHLGKYGFQSKWFWRASKPERMFGRETKNRVQLINVVSCHPSPSAGRSGETYEVVPAIVTLGMRPLAKFPYEADPVNNDIIVEPSACAHESHPPHMLTHQGDEGISVGEYQLRDVSDIRDDRYYDDLAYMSEHGVDNAAVTAVDFDDGVSFEDDNKIKAERR